MVSVVTAHNASVLLLAFHRPICGPHRGVHEGPLGAKGRIGPNVRGDMDVDIDRSIPLEVERDVARFPKSVPDFEPWHIYYPLFQCGFGSWDFGYGWVCLVSTAKEVLLQSPYPPPRPWSTTLWDIRVIASISADGHNRKANIRHLLSNRQWGNIAFLQFALSRILHLLGRSLRRRLRLVDQTSIMPPHVLDM